MTRKEFEINKEKFLVYLKETKLKSTNTQRSYCADLSQFLYFWQSAEKDEDQNYIFDTAIEKYFSMLKGSAISNSSIARKTSCINSLVRYFKQQGIANFKKLKRPFIKVQVPITLNINEIFKLLDTIDSDALSSRYPNRDRAIIELLYATGIRCSEIIEIELTNVNLSSNILVVRSKNKKERMVLFGTQAAKRIEQYITIERPRAKSNNEKLFLNHQAEPLTSRSVQRIVAAFREFVETKHKITPSILRHSFANHLLRNGADAQTVQELLGLKTRISIERYQKNGNII